MTEDIHVKQEALWSDGVRAKAALHCMGPSHKSSLYSHAFGYWFM